MRKVISVILCIVLALSFGTTAFAQDSRSIDAAPKGDDDAILNYMASNDLTTYDKDVKIVIPNKVFLDEKDAGKLPGITTGFYFEDEDDIMKPRTFGVGYVIGRVRSWTTASNGYIRTGYKSGTFSAIASIALSFVNTVPTMTISTILSVVSLIAGSNDMVSGETLVTYRYKYRDGEGRWSSDPNTSGYWHLGLRTGQRETYKHVVGGKLNQSTQIWTLTMKNYNTSPARTENSLNYTQSDSWLALQGKQRVETGLLYVETPW